MEFQELAIGLEECGRVEAVFLLNTTNGRLFWKSSMFSGFSGISDFKIFVAPSDCNLCLLLCSSNVYHVFFDWSFFCTCYFDSCWWLGDFWDSMIVLGVCWVPKHTKSSHDKDPQWISWMSDFLFARHQHHLNRNKTSFFFTSPQNLVNTCASWLTRPNLLILNKLAE